MIAPVRSFARGCAARALVRSRHRRRTTISNECSLLAHCRCGRRSWWSLSPGAGIASLRDRRMHCATEAGSDPRVERRVSEICRPAQQPTNVERRRSSSPERRRRIRAPRITAVGDESTVHKDELHGRRPVANLNAPSAESVSRSVCGLPRTTTVLSRCDWGADEKWRRQSSEYDPVNAGRASRESNEMRPLRYSINLTLDGCCHHEAGLPRTRSRCATGPLRWNEPMPCYSAG